MKIPLKMCLKKFGQLAWGKSLISLAKITCVAVFIVWLLFLYWGRVENNSTWNDLYQQPYKFTGHLFRQKPLVIWSNDYHIGPIGDLKHLLAPLGVYIIDKSLSGHCRLRGTCAYGLRVLNSGNAMNLEDPSLITRFFESYKDDPIMKAVDAFVCFHPSAMCEAFMPFNKSLIVIASTRYELGRFAVDRWKKLNRNLIKMSTDPKNVIAGNNKYDAEYIRYFTGIKTEVLPSYCGYIGETYNRTRDGFLLAPVHAPHIQDTFLWEFSVAQQRWKTSFKLNPLRSVYPKYKYTDLTAHQGLVYLPYQVSVMSFFEQYRMNIPCFFPSLDFLTELHYKYGLLIERSWDRLFGLDPRKSRIPGVLPGVPDPNNEVNKTAIRHWIKYSDFYQFPHIILFESVDDLVWKMQSTDLKAVSRRMSEFNQKQHKALLQKWTVILKRIAKYSENHPR